MRTRVPPRSLTTKDLLAQLESSWWAFHEHGSEADARYADELEQELERRAAES